MYLLFRKWDSAENALFKRPHTKHADLVFGEETPVTTLDILLGQSGKIYAIEFDNMVAETFKDATNDAVTSGMDLNTYLLFVGITCIIDGIRLDITILKRNTFSNLSDITSRYIAVEIYMIDLFLEEHGMSQLAGQFSVVGKQKNTGRIAVKSADRIDAFAASLGNKVHHRLTILRVFAGRHIAFGLVQENIYLLFSLNLLIMEQDNVAAEHLMSEFRNDFTVHRHYSCGNILVGIATTAYTGIGKELVQTDGFIGIIRNFLIVYTALSRILTLERIVFTRSEPSALLVSTVLIAATMLAIALETIATLLITSVLITTTVLETSALLIATFGIIRATLAATLIAFTALLITATLESATLLVASLLIIAVVLTTLTATLVAFTALITAVGIVLSTLTTALIALTTLLIATLLVASAGITLAIFIIKISSTTAF